MTERLNVKLFYCKKNFKWTFEHAIFETKYKQIALFISFLCHYLLLIKMSAKN